MADALVAAHAARHIHDIAADPLADIGHFVDEAHLGGEERIGRIFDELRRNQVGADQFDAAFGEGAVELLEQRQGGVALGADHDAVRRGEVVDRVSFPQELRIRRDVEREPGVGLGDDALDLEAGACRDGRLGHDHRIVVERAADLRGCRIDILQIGIAIEFARRRADRDDDDGRVPDRLGDVGGEAQAAGADIVLHQFLQAGLVDRHDAILQPVDLVGELCRRR